MSLTGSSSTFVRPPGSKIYGPTGPSLVLPRRINTTSVKRSIKAAPNRENIIGDARQQIMELLALLREVDIPGRTAAESDDQNQELSRSLQQLEAELASREYDLGQREVNVAERERDLAEAETLMKHHRDLLAAVRRTSPVRPGLSEEERVALRGLKDELDRQEVILREAKEDLRNREKFIEESERCLFEKLQNQQVKETELEQREENILAREKELGIGGHKTEEKKPEFDEFNE